MQPFVFETYYDIRVPTSCHRPDPLLKKKKEKTDERCQATLKGGCLGTRDRF
jgi:hypothetical protein